MQWFLAASPILQALLAGTFTWLVTALGAGVVVFGGVTTPASFDAMLGFASGVMLAASYWSLLEPAIALAEAQGSAPWLPPAVGFVLGAGVLAVVDKILPHLHPGHRVEEAEGPKTQWSRTTLLITAITLHNIPEGLAVGVAFGAAAGLAGTDPGITASVGAAIALALGIGIQNVPEGAAVALPLRTAGVSRRASFLAGSASAAVEPIAAVIGAAFVLVAGQLLPYALAFAAGAMIWVVIEELIPAAHEHGRSDLVTLSAIAGFTLMMVLDVALG